MYIINSPPVKTSLFLGIKKNALQFFYGKSLNKISVKHSHSKTEKSVVKMMRKRTYEDAIKALNGLQSNAATILKMQKENKGSMDAAQKSLPDMEILLSRIGIKVEDLDRLNVIHVSGTKGKGSSCAFCESILRRCGLKTGFYSSPHLVEVRERIRLNGQPLAHDLFARYFFDCYDRLLETAPVFNNEMPGFFRFLTLMAFHVYLDQNVDVAILEVGIGGSFDCTNIIRTPVVCGITKLEIDHANILGNTIERIAWHKAGIMKSKRPAITIPQVKEAEEILFERAKELDAHLHTIPMLSEFDENFPEFKVQGMHQHINVAMAVQLARVWLREKREFAQNLLFKSESDRANFFTPLFPDVCQLQNAIGTFKLPEQFITGLQNAQWLGRCQVVQKTKMTFYLDGAHTSASMEACAQWFKQTARKCENTAQVLLFFITGERDSMQIMRELRDINFDLVVFCPTIYETKLTDNTCDLTNLNQSRDSRLQKCVVLEQTWLKMFSKSSVLDDKMPLSTKNVLSNTFVLPSISSAVSWIANGREPDIERPHENNPEYPASLRKPEHIQVLVAGSLHLVGGVLKFLGPDAYNFLE